MTFVLFLARHRVQIFHGLPTITRAAPSLAVFSRHASGSRKKREPHLVFDKDTPIEADAPALPPLPATTPKKRRSRSQKPAPAASAGPAEVDSQPSTDSDVVPAVRDNESRSTSEQVIEIQLEQALREHKIPDSPLAKTIFRNWKRFPDCIVLTRVGKFYESYYEAAKHLTSIIDLKLTHKTQRAMSLVPGKDGPFLQFPFAGFPVMALDKYLKILVQDLGHTVVLVEEEPGEVDSDGLKPRRVGQVITPGTLLDVSWFNSADSRYLLSIAVAPEESVVGSSPGSLGLWISYTDVSTGDFFSKGTSLAKLEDELTRIAPREIILDESFRSQFLPDQSSMTDDHSPVSELLGLLRLLGVHISFADTYRPPEIEGSAESKTPPNDQALSLEAQSISLLRHHLIFALRQHAPDLSRPDRQLESAYMHIDTATLTGLEIRHAIRYGEEAQQSPVSVKGTLLSVIDKTVTPGGHRLLVRTVSAPLMDIPQVEERQALVQAFVRDEDLRTEVQGILKPLRDLPRLIQRIKHSRGSIDDLWEIGAWIRGITSVTERINREIQGYQDGQYILEDTTDEHVKTEIAIGRDNRERLERWIGSLHDVSELRDRIENTMRGEIIRALQVPEVRSQHLVTDADDTNANPVPVEEEEEKVLLEEGDIVYPEGMNQTNQKLYRRFSAAEIALSHRWWINPEATEELRRLHKKLVMNSKKRDALQANLQKEFCMSTLVMMLIDLEKFGPVVLVSKAADRDSMAKQPGFRKFTHPGFLRYVEYDAWTKLGKERRAIIDDLETAQREIYVAMQDEVRAVAASLTNNAKVVDELDLCMAFAQTADDWQWVRPTLTNELDFQVTSASHPVVEAALLASARGFVRNSIGMTAKNHLHIITGPNQGGKSTLLRQTAIIAILAQSGSFVPAEEARIGIFDKLFSRIGARDDLFRDRSTFMLEMVETAGILRDATNRSLVIMDEIGRGTTLQAGMAIAYATLDYILNNIGCRTLFATHYHELEDLLRITTPSGTQSRPGVEYWCTDVDDAGDGAVSYSYHLRQGINYNSHAILAARMAGMPPEFIKVAGEKLDLLQAQRKMEKARLLPAPAESESSGFRRSAE